MSAETDEGVSTFDRRNIHAIMGGHGTWFSAELLRLCAKADAQNLARIERGFPEHVALFREWWRS